MMSDPRFARLRTDPRFRRPRKHQSKVIVDERFKDILVDTGLKGKGKGKGKGGEGTEARVDKYGRKPSETQEHDNLRRFYRLEDDGKERGDTQGAEKDAAIPTILDYARGAVLMESSDEEEEEGATKEQVRVPGDESDESGSDVGGFITLGDDPTQPKSQSELYNGVEELEIDLDEDTIADLDAQVAAYAKSLQKDEVTDVQKTRRLAVVNLDWDYVRAIHLYKIFSSLVSPTAPASSTTSIRTRPDREGIGKSGAANVVRGRILSVRVYPSEFGKKRMAREEKEGPPPEVFKKKKLEDSEEVNEKTIYETGSGEDYDEDALRTYQLERLRYYYAIVECDTAEAAAHIYNELEGTELERSANVFDLSFVPDGMLFDEECRDEATEQPHALYRAVDFVTDALRHSKVKLTWDEDDAERNHFTRRPLTKREIEEADFRAYIASSSSEGEESDGREVDKKAAKHGQKDKASRKAASRNKLRALLFGGDNEELPEGWGGDAFEDSSKGKDREGSDLDMEITFMPGLSEAKTPDDETTLERYQRRLKEKRKKKKEEAKDRGGVGAAVKDSEGKRSSHGALDDGFFGAGSASEQEGEFQGCEGKKTQKSENGLPPRQPTSKEELALLVASDNPLGEPRHFDMKAILKAEKKGRRGKKGYKQNNKDEDEVLNEIQDDFVIDVKDERFKALHEDHQFAIDPSHPHFKKTKSMATLLEERSKRQKSLVPQDKNGTRAQGAVNVEGNRNLQDLVERVKRKSGAADQGGVGKRRKL